MSSKIFLTMVRLARSGDRARKSDAGVESRRAVWAIDVEVAEPEKSQV